MTAAAAAAAAAAATRAFEIELDDEEAEEEDADGADNIDGLLFKFIPLADVHEDEDDDEEDEFDTAVIRRPFNAISCFSFLNAPSWLLEFTEPFCFICLKLK